jgi:hypothetical protein
LVLSPNLTSLWDKNARPQGQGKENIMATYASKLKGQTGKGLLVGESTSELVGFFGKTPVDQPATIADATDAATAITTVNTVIDRLQELGLIA